MATERVGIHSFAELEASIGNAKTAADIKTAYESNANTNEFSDSEQSKLAGIEAGADVNPTDAEIKTAYENNANTNAFTDAEQSKLSGISTGAEVNAVDSVNTQTGSVILDADDIDDTATTNKFTTASDISKLSGIESGAEVNDVDSVFGRTGAVTAQSGDYTKSDVGLGNVDNTTDLSKPISTATQTALDAKQGDITLTTTGTSGAATLVGDTLNIPNYASGGGGGTVTEVTANAPLSVTSGTTTPDLTLAQATALANGFLTSTDWSAFNTGAGLAATANQDSTATILGGNLTGTINSVAVATVTSGAALGATANQDSTATILAGDLTGTVNSVAVATVTAGAALGATANQDSNATILSGDLTGTVNSIAVATVTSGAALGTTSTQPSDNVSTLTNDADYLPSDPTGVTGADVITNIMSLTQAEYDAITTPDASTLYIIT